MLSAKGQEVRLRQAREEESHCQNTRSGGPACRATDQRKQLLPLWLNCGSKHIGGKLREIFSYFGNGKPIQDYELDADLRDENRANGAWYLRDECLAANSVVN
jgi:hypothetical protein